jgi:hypothetical protein
VALKSKKHRARQLFLSVFSLSQGDAFYVATLLKLIDKLVNARLDTGLVLVATRCA